MPREKWQERDAWALAVFFLPLLLKCKDLSSWLFLSDWQWRSWVRYPFSSLAPFTFTCWERPGQWERIRSRRRGIFHVALQSAPRSAGQELWYPGWLPGVHIHHWCQWARQEHAAVTERFQIRTESFGGLKVAFSFVVERSSPPDTLQKPF